MSLPRPNDRNRRDLLATPRLARDTAWYGRISEDGTTLNAMLDAKQEGDSYRRAKVITGSANGR